MGGGCSAHDSIHSASQADGQTHVKFKPKRRLFPVFSRFQVLNSNHNCSIALLGIQNKHTHFHCSIRLYIFHFIKFKSIPTPSPQWTWPHLRHPRLQHNTFSLFSSILKFCNAYQNFPSIWTRRNCQNLLVTRKKWRKYFFYWYVHECVCVYQCCYYCCCWCLCIDAVVVGFLSHVFTVCRLKFVVVSRKKIFCQSPGRFNRWNIQNFMKDLRIQDSCWLFESGWQHAA